MTKLNMMIKEEKYGYKRKIPQKITQEFYCMKRGIDLLNFYDTGGILIDDDSIRKWISITGEYKLVANLITFLNCDERKTWKY